MKHPRASTFGTGAAAGKGLVAEQRDHVKRCDHKGYTNPGFNFIPALVEAQVFFLVPAPGILPQHPQGWCVCPEGPLWRAAPP